MVINKPKVIKSYSKLDKQLQEQIKFAYTDDFASKLIHFFDKNGLKITVLPFETEEKYYMIRMTENEAVTLVDEEEAYNDDDFLKHGLKQHLEM